MLLLLDTHTLLVDFILRTTLVPQPQGSRQHHLCKHVWTFWKKKRKNISSPTDHHTAWTSVVTQALPTTQSFPDIIPVWILTSNIDQEYFNTKKMEVCSPLAWQSTEMQCRSWLLLDTWLLCKVFVFMHLIQQINRTINLCAKLVPLGLVVSSGTQVQRGKSKDTQKCPALPWQSQG